MAAQQKAKIFALLSNVSAPDQDVVLSFKTATSSGSAQFSFVDNFNLLETNQLATHNISVVRPAQFVHLGQTKECAQLVITDLFDASKPELVLCAAVDDTNIKILKGKTEQYGNQVALKMLHS